MTSPQLNGIMEKSGLDGAKRSSKEKEWRPKHCQPTNNFPSLYEGKANCKYIAERPINVLRSDLFVMKFLFLGNFTLPSIRCETWIHN
jgi:hypothetical protein